MHLATITSLCIFSVISFKFDLTALKTLACVNQCLKLTRIGTKAVCVNVRDCTQWVTRKSR